MTFADFSKKKSETIGTLYNEGYFFNGTCGDVASSALEFFDLPKIGENKPVKGRLSFDRSRDLDALPTIKDGISASDETIELSATPLKNQRHQWRLTIERKSRSKSSGRVGHMMTHLDFSTRPSSGAKNCEFERVEFIVEKNKFEADCFALFLFEDDASSPESSSRHLKSRMKKDCALALHYSGEAKRSLGL